jgi:hypothetical protein
MMASYYSGLQEKYLIVINARHDTHLNSAPCRSFPLHVFLHLWGLGPFDGRNHLRLVSLDGTVPGDLVLLKPTASL